MVGEGGGGGGGGGGQNIMAIIKWPPPNCRIQDVTWLALFVHLSGLFISFYFHAFNTKIIVVGEGGGGGGGGGGGQNIMAIIKWPPPHPPTAEYKMLPR